MTAIADETGETAKTSEPQDAPKVQAADRISRPMQSIIMLLFWAGIAVAAVAAMAGGLLMLKLIANLVTHYLR